MSSNQNIKATWPPISPQLVRAVNDWVMANVPTYKPGDTSDACLGVLAFHAGMRHVVGIMRVTQQSQERATKKTAIHTTTQ